MTTTAFSKSEAIRFGWTTMKSNFGFFIVLMVVFYVVAFVPAVLQGFLEEEAPVPAMVVGLAGFVINMIIGMGLIEVSLRFAASSKPTLADLFSKAYLFFKYLLGTLLYGLIVLGGLILLVVPGIVWGIKFSFYTYAILDEELGPIEALKKSAAITAGAKWNLFLFWILLFGVNLLGLLALLIGLFATLPTTMVAMGFVYRTLLARAEGNGAVSPASAPSH